MAEYGRGRNHHHRSRSTSRSRSRPLPPAPARELPPTPDMVEQRPQYEYVNEPLETIAESPVSPRRREEYLAPSRDLPGTSGSGRQSPMPPRATSPSVPVWLHRRLNSNGQTPRAMSPLPAVPAVR
ncbi:hypothetical protein K474DRAFT_1656772 [Panus rudis PR-1116 ss-1]|nr:hypothetical protein K474DRAFT_1656772 [Panus rudis PR-1116 ss-1]